MAARILLVDDDESVRQLTGDMLETFGYEVERVGDGALAQERIESQEFEIALLDIDLPHLDGEELFRGIREKELATEVIFITGNSSIDRATSLLRAGAFDYLVKPIDLETLKGAVVRALAKQRQLQNQLLLIKKLMTKTARLETRIAELTDTAAKAEAKQAAFDEMRAHLKTARAELLVERANLALMRERGPKDDVDSGDGENEESPELLHAREEMATAQQIVFKVHDDLTLMHDEVAVLRDENKRLKHELTEAMMMRSGDEFEHNAVVKQMQEELESLHQRYDEQARLLDAFRSTTGPDEGDGGRAVDRLMAGLAAEETAGSGATWSRRYMGLGVLCLLVGVVGQALLPRGPAGMHVRNVAAGQAFLLGTLCLAAALHLRLRAVTGFLRTLSGKQAKGAISSTERLLTTVVRVARALGLLFLAIALCSGVFGLWGGGWRALVSPDPAAAQAFIDGSDVHGASLLALGVSVLFFLGMATATSYRIYLDFLEVVRSKLDKKEARDRLEDICDAAE